MKRIIQFAAGTALVALAYVGSAVAAGLNVPQKVTAGQPLNVQGAPDGTMYLFGPNVALKQKVSGGSVQIDGDQLKSAGFYTLSIGDASASFFVTNDKAASVAFIARPSRVPAAASDAISGTAFIFDKYNNLVMQPTPVKFDLQVEGSSTVDKSDTSKDGIAWVQLASGKRAGAAQFIASAGDASVKRVVQQTAADPCNIRMKASRASDGGIEVETDPIRDCSGNAVPDGTIVTFTSVDEKGRSTVDARIKKGIAKAELPASNSAQLSVAAGVVMGNEIRWGGGK